MLSILNENHFDIRHRRFKHPELVEGCDTCRKMRDLRGWEDGPDE